MSRPASYTGTATVDHAKATDFEDAFDPLKWPTTAPYLWTDTYLITQTSPGANDLPLHRSDPPLRDPPLDHWSDRRLFEGAVFGGILYRNILQTSLVKTPNPATPTQIALDYKQVGCLDAQAYRPFDGGIDLDYGNGSAVETATGTTTQVKLTVSKTVHFTQPKPVSHDVNLLAHIMVPLSFDFWLHCGLFIQET